MECHEAAAGSRSEKLSGGKSVSLLAKWIKTADSKNTETRKLGILTAQKLGYPVYNFKRIVRSLRKYIGVLEVKMSEGKWEEIVYPEVSGRAMMIYRNAFRKHDESVLTSIWRRHWMEKKRFMRRRCTRTISWKKFCMDVNGIRYWRRSGGSCRIMWRRKRMQLSLQMFPVP